MATELVLATRNRGKEREFRALLEGLQLVVVTLKEVGFSGEVVEDGKSLEENARKKALAVTRAIGKLVLADDSGLEVDALGGRPGVHSARYAGPGASDADNNAKLVAELRDVAPPLRTARYRVVLALADLAGPLGSDVHFETGACEGVLRLQPGGEHGFGYDPYFVPAGYTQTMAELGPEIKNRISHRAKAASALRRFLSEYLRR